MSLVDEVRTVRQRVVTRLRELEPLVREYEELLVLARELGIPVPGEATATGKQAARGTAVDAGASEPGGPAAERRTPGPGRPSPADTRTPGPGRPSPADTHTSEPGRPAPAAESERDARLLAALLEKPGATTAELASILGIPATSLYRPIRELTNSGAIVKRGRGLYVS